MLNVVPEEEAKINKKKQELILYNSNARSVGISGKRMTDFTNKLHFCSCVKLESNWNLWSIDNWANFTVEVLTLQNGNFAIA